MLSDFLHLPRCCRGGAHVRRVPRGADALQHGGGGCGGGGGSGGGMRRHRQQLHLLASPRCRPSGRALMSNKEQAVIIRRLHLSGLLIVLVCSRRQRAAALLRCCPQQPAGAAAGATTASRWSSARRAGGAPCRVREGRRACVGRGRVRRRRSSVVALHLGFVRLLVGRWRKATPQGARAKRESGRRRPARAVVRPLHHHHATDRRDISSGGGGLQAFDRYG